MLTYPDIIVGVFFMTETRINSIRRSSTDLMEAWKKNDFEILNNLLHKDFQFISAEIPGFRYNKMQWLEIAVNKYEVFEYRYEFLNISQSAFLTLQLSRLTMLTSVSFHEKPNRYLVTDVWKEEDNRWKLLLRQPVLLF